MLNVLSVLILPIMIVGIVLVGLIKKVPVYESFVSGAKEGFDIAVRIIPYLVAILFAIGMFRASGAMDFLIYLLSPVFSWIGVSPEIIGMAIVRPLSGSGSVGILADLITQFGEESLVVKMAATMFGSTETTFYVIAVYFGAVGVKKVRYALKVGLMADFTGIVASIIISLWLFS